MNSEQWFERATKMIPGGVSSPVRAFKHVGATPVYFEKAKGAYLYDVDGKEYVDFCMSFGPHVLGHLPNCVVEAVTAQAQKAMTFGACHPGEVELAEELLKAYPFLQKVRLVNSGTEAVMTAVRLARGFTGRDKIVKFEGCYHGHSDGFLAKAGSGVAELAEASSKGVPQSVVDATIVCRLDDPKQIEEIFAKHGKEIAAVIMELIPANDGLLIPEREYWEKVFKLARQNDALVIADEVITGFRLSLNGASGFFDLKPDLVTLGKIIGGGMPLAAVVGRGAIMDFLAPQGPVYQAGTLSGNPMATAAGLAVLKELRATDPYPKLEVKLQKFIDDLSAVLPGPFQIRAIASLFWIQLQDPQSQLKNPSTAFPPPISPGEKERYAKLFRLALKEGVYLPPSCYEVGFLSTAHDDGVLRKALEAMKRACRQFDENAG